MQNFKRMKKEDLKEVAEKMKKIDFCLMTTAGEKGKFNSRPMSNNGEVEFDGDSWFFTYQDTDKIREIKKNPAVSLNFSGDGMIFIHVAGHARIITDKNLMKKYWLPSLEMWFPEGVDTEGIAMIEVKAETIKYWNKEKEATINL